MTDDGIRSIRNALDECSPAQLGSWGTFVDAMLGMNEGEVWTRRKFITNTTELQLWLGWDPRMPKGLQLGIEGQGRRVILCAKIGAVTDPAVYVPTWDDYDAEDWMCRSRPS